MQKDYNLCTGKDTQDDSRKKTAKKTKRPAYPYRDLYSKILESRIGGQWFAEFPFHPKRKWRFDYANPDAKVAIEIDGGLYNQYKGLHAGRHSGGIGQKEDLVKLNAAAELGWIVLHYVPSEKMKAETMLQIHNTITIKQQLMNYGTEA